MKIGIHTFAISQNIRPWTSPNWENWPTKLWCVHLNKGIWHRQPIPGILKLEPYSKVKTPIQDCYRWEVCAYDDDSRIRLAKHNSGDSQGCFKRKKETNQLTQVSNCATDLWLNKYVDYKLNIKLLFH